MGRDSWCRRSTVAVVSSPFSLAGLVSSYGWWNVAAYSYLYKQLMICINLAQSCNLFKCMASGVTVWFSFLSRDLRVMLGFYFFVQLILASSLSGRSETIAVNVTRIPLYFILVTRFVLCCRLWSVGSCWLLWRLVTLQIQWTPWWLSPGSKQRWRNREANGIWMHAPHQQVHHQQIWRPKHEKEKKSSSLWTSPMFSQG